MEGPELCNGRICRQTVSPGLKLEAIRTNEETVRVNWYATTATNVEGYILERSLGNNAPFEQVHYIKADPSITTQAFQFNDNNSYAEKSIYRVVQVFLSGERLEKKAVAGGYNTDLKVTAYPNPSAHNFTLFIQSRRDEPLQLRVVDVLGRVVEQKDNLPANQLIEIGAQYRTGIFFVQILQAGKTKQVKVEKRDSQAQ